MSDIKSEILFTDFGLNQDDDLRYVGMGQSPYNLNVLKGEDGSYGVITNMKGNRKITYPLGLSNAYFVLGSCYDPLTRNVYYFIFSQPYDVTGSGDYEYDNRLVRFNEDSEVIDTIFYDNKNYFRLDPTKELKDPFVLGEWLYFNPRESEPKMIHIEMAYNYTNYDVFDSDREYLYGEKMTFLGGLFMALSATTAGQTPVTHEAKWERQGDSYQDETDLTPVFDSEFRYAFFQLKHIPVYRPQCLYATDEDKHANAVRGKLFKFTHRYKYFDNSYSRWSAHSDVTLPLNDEYYNGEVPNNIDEFNCIDVLIHLHSAALIKEIEIAFKETGGIWRRAKIINRRDITILDQLSYTYKFYNTDSAYDAIDDTYLYEPYDSVPKKANSQELINKNILCYGGCTEGFFNIDKNDIDVTLLPEIEAITIPDAEEIGGRRRDNIAENDWVYITSGGVQYRRLYPNAWFTGGGWSAGDVFQIRLDGQTETYILQAGDVLDLAAFCSALQLFLMGAFPAITFQYSTTSVSIVGTSLLGISLFYETSGVSEVALTKKRGHKTGSWHPYCLYYYDEAMRRCDAQTSKENNEGDVAWEIDGTTVYVPMANEYSPLPLTTANKWNINWTVNHLPPAYAKWWRWGTAGGSLASYFVQYTIAEIEDDGVLTRMNISPLQTLKFTDEATWNEFPQSIIDPYQWVKGDRVRIITEDKDGTDMGAVVDGVYDYEILKYEESDDDPIKYWIYTQDFDFASIGVEEDSLIEIYRPLKSEMSPIFYEKGELMPIIEDSMGVMVHGCGATGTQSQDTGLDLPATGVFTHGDVYHILRTPSKPINGITGYFHESMWYSDFYDSDDWDKGRIGVETSFGERTLNIIRFSNQYLQNTLINGLSTFNGSDYKELNDLFGAIMRIIEIGDTLKVYQRKKPSSIPIGRTQYFDAKGNANVEVQSDRVFGAVNYSSTNYGTEFPESIVRNNRYVYGFDIYNGVMWRDAPNGLFPISGRYISTEGSDDYKMETYFKEKAKQLLISGIEGVSVLTTWDERHKNLYVVFKDIVTDANNEAIVFHEPSNKWICFTNMDQTLTEGWNMPIELDYWIVKGFEGGIGFLFDEDTRFAVFNITTNNDESAQCPLQSLVLTQYTPTVTVSPSITASLRNVLFSPLTPTVVVTYAQLDGSGADAMGWTAAQSGESVADTTILSLYPINGRVLEYFDTTTLTTPTWLTVKGNAGTQLVVNSPVNNGNIITVYPSSVNAQGDPIRVARITFINAPPSNPSAYSDTVTLTITQQAAPYIAPISITPTMVADTSVPNGIIISGTPSVATNDQTTTVTYSLSCTRLGTNGTQFQVSWRATINGSALLGGTGTFMANDGGATLGSLTLASQPSAGDTIIIYISTPIVSTSGSVTASLRTITLTQYAVTVISSYVSPAPAALSWFAAEGGYDDYQEVTLTAPPTSCYIYSIPSWISVWSDGGTLLHIGSVITNGGVIRVAPTIPNTGGVKPISYLTFRNSYTSGDDHSVVCNQAAYIAPPAEENIIPTISKYSGDYNLTIKSFNTQITTGQTSFTVYGCILDSAIKGTGESLKIYWKAYHNGSIQIGGGEFNVLDNTFSVVTLTLTTAPDVGDTITIILSSVYF